MSHLECYRVLPKFLKKITMSARVAGTRILSKEAPSSLVPTSTGTCPKTPPAPLSSKT